MSLVIYKNILQVIFFLNETCYLARKFDGAGGGASSDVIALKSEEARKRVEEKERGETRRRQICVTALETRDRLEIA